jgi:hypothetical protein
MDPRDLIAMQMMQNSNGITPNYGRKSAYDEPAPLSTAFIKPLDFQVQSQSSSIVPPVSMPNFAKQGGLDLGPDLNTGTGMDRGLKQLKDMRKVPPFMPQPIPELRTPTENFAVSSRRPRIHQTME